MKIIQIIFLLYSIQVALGQCNEGCLRCSQQEECLFCDPLQGYVLEDKKCVQNIVENCQEYNYDSKCKLCKDDFYLSLKENQCLEVMPWTKIENCKKYQNSDNCLYCNEGFYQVKGQCVQVKQVIENCDIYYEADRCLQCKEGFSILQPDMKVCRENLLVENCKAYSPISCQECPDGQISFQNFQIENFLEHLLDDDITYQTHHILMYQKKSLFIKENCYTPKINNCQQYKDIYSCYQCEDGYYEKQGRCYKEPESQIQFCEQYTNSQICQKCKQGYFLKTSSLCLPVERIENCQLYNPKSEDSQCIKCSEKFFVQNNQCVKRTNFVDKCEDYYPLGDYCQNCQQYYQLTDDSLKCLPEIYNCLIYQNSSRYQSELYCRYCVDEYYFDKINKLCVKGSVSSCRVYKPDQEECEKCHNKYYLKDGVCLRHDEIENCDRYNQSQKNLCDTCNFDSWYFSKETECLPAHIEGCQDYSSTTTCQKCKDWYDYQDDKNCIPIPEELHCKRSVFKLCKECQEGYILENDSCRLPHNYLIQNCMKYTTDGISTKDDDIECQKCAYATTPINYQESYFCIRKEFVKNPIKNCKNYSQDVNGNFVCDYCYDGFYLNEGQCLTECPPNKIIQRTKVQYNGTFMIYLNKDVCVLPTFSNCLIEGFKVSPSFSISTACLKYTDSVYKFLDFSQDSRILYGIDLQQTNEDQNIYQLPTYELKTSINIENLLGKKQQGYIPNCQAYLELGFLDKIGCAQCKFGYYGKTKNWKIDHCYIYTTFDKNSAAADYKQNLTCQECLDFYYLDTDGLKCLEIPLIVGCEKYYTKEDKCEACMEGYYLPSSQTQCLLNTVQNCIYKSPIENKCIKCDHDYMLNFDSTLCVLKIPSCLEQSQQSPYKCETCDYFHYPSQTANSVQNICIHGTIPHCWLYDQTQTNKCLKYQNVLYYYQDNLCNQNLSIDNCLVYRNHDQCQVCDQKVSYLIESAGVCCLYNYYYNGNTCQQITDENCSESQFNTSNKCSKCKNYFNLFTHSSGDNYCCKHGHYLNGTNCVQEFNMALNTINCSVYDNVNMSCTSCQTGYYLSSKFSICCQELKYDQDGTCQTIPISNCLQYDFDNSVCKKCAQTATVGANTVNVTNNQYCCLETQYLSGQTCVDIPTSLNCTGVYLDGQTVKCTNSCNLGYYYDSQHSVCCSNNGNPVQYYNGNTCTNVTSIIANCIKYNDQQVCTQCDSTYYLTNDKLKCCQANQFYDGTNCVQKDANFDKCTKFEQSKCVECQDGYHIQNDYCYPDGSNTTTSLTDQGFLNCKYASSDLLSCAQCENNHYQILTDLKKCCPIGQILVSQVCTDISISLNNCAITQLSDYTCSECQHDGTNYYYKANATDQCCKFGQFYQSNTCTDIPSNENCLAKNGAACLKCKDGFYKNASNTCTQLPTYCAKVDSTYACELCIEGYTLKLDKSCVLPQTLTNIQSCPIQLDVLNQNCVSLDETVSTTTCKCLNCKTGYYGDFCCKHGYYFNTSAQKCAKIKNQNCSEYNGQNQQCTKCFVDSEQQLSQNQKWQLQIVFPQINDQILSNGQYESQVIEQVASKNYLGSDSNQCCPHQYYWKDNSCVQIPIKNCKKYENDLCSECVENYTYNSTYRVCCRFNEIVNTNTGLCQVDSSFTDICPANKYVTNGVCCDSNTYYNLEFQKCLPLLDQNCIQSVNGLVCDQCAQGFSKNFEIYAKFSLFNISIQKNTSENTTKFVQLCSSYTHTTHKLTQNIIQSQKNCQIFDQAKGECNTAIENYTANKISCPDGYTHILSSQYQICRLESAIDQNCAVYQGLNDCKKCKQGYILTNNICCPENMYFNSINNTCQPKIENCEILDLFNFGCKKCQEGYYFSKSYCCRLGFYYNEVFQKCQRINNKGLFSCAKSQNNIDCDECIGENFYLNKQRCCTYGTHWNEKQCVKNQKILDCKVFDDYGNCIQCNDNKKLYNQTCCDYDQVLSFPGSCTNGSISQCTEYNIDSECLQCDANFYLSSNKCCSDGQYEKQNQCVSVSQQDNWSCGQVNDSGTCIKCNSISYDNSTEPCCPYGQYYDSGQSRCRNITSISNCIELGRLDQNCLLCGNNLMAYAQSCITMQDNCRQKSSSQCLRCKDGYYKDPGYSFYCSQNGYRRISGVNYIIEDDVSRFQTCIQSYSCQICSIQYPDYLNNDQCVLFGQIYDSGSRKQIDIEIGALGFSFCRQATSDSSQCQYCKFGYKKKQGENKVCELNEVDYRYDCSADVNGDCEYCKDGLYLTNKRCCPEMTYFNQDVNQCVPINHNTSLDLNTTNTDICLQISNTLCLKCETGYTLTNGACCQGNKIFDGQCKDFDASSGIQMCKEFQFINSNKVCRQIGQDDDWRIDSCVQPDSGTRFYFISNHCCELGQMWSSNMCSTISSVLTEPIFATCQMVDESGQCIKNNNYVSDSNNICTEGQYYDGASCGPVTIQNCLQQIGGICVKCSTERSFDQKCCDQQVYQSANTCADYVIANCQVPDTDPTKCKLCEPFYYLQNDQCIPQGQYLDGLTLTDISVQNCVEYNTIDFCTKCIQGYHVSYQNCCKLGQVYLDQKGCVDEQFVTNNCLKFNSDQNVKIKCEKCKSSKIPEQGICCNNDQFYDNQQTNSKYYCRDVNLVDQRCQLYDTSGCQKCKDQYSFTATNSVTVGAITFDIGQCCPTGYTLKDVENNKKQCDYDPQNFIQHCISFNNSRQCTQCQQNYNLVTDNINNKVYCCEKGQFSENGECKKLSYFENNCLLFDSSTMKCIVCNVNYHSSNGFCVSYGNYYDQQTNTEVESINSLYCKYPTQNTCNECRDNTQQYLLNNYCCPFDYYWNLKYNKCVRNPTTYCKKYDGNLKKCIECNEGSDLYDNLVCCPNNSVLFNGECTQVINNCKNYQKDTSDIKCKECDINYYLNFDQKVCCSANQVLNKENKCLSNINFQYVFKNCYNYDFENIKCTQCKPGFYPSEGICCQYGQIFNKDTRQCTNFAMPSNCTQYDQENSRCSFCQHEYYLMKDYSCKKFENCLEFDYANEKCKKCFNGYYETNSQCCLEGYIHDGNICVNKLSQDFCLRYSSNTSCQKCIERYYLVQDSSNDNFCCPEGSYCSQTKTVTPGEVKFCRQYNTDQNDCVLCQKDFSLMNKLRIFDQSTTEIICYPLAIENCEKSSFKIDTITGNSENILQCETCQNLFQKQSIANKTIDKVFTHTLVENCSKYDNSYLFNQSSFLCLGCEPGFYLETDSSTLQQQCLPRDKSSKQQNCYENNHEFDTDICIECDQGFYINNGECQVIPDINCLYYTQADSCLYFDYQTNYVYMDYSTMQYPNNVRRDSIVLKTQEAIPPYYYNGYIETCEKNYQCDNDFVKGIPVYLQKYLSCHKCIENNRIPFVSIFFDFFSSNDDGLLRFSMANKNTSNLSDFVLGQENHQNMCILKDLSEFELEGTNNFPENCSIGIINAANRASSQLANDQTSQISQLSVFCGSCYPGYRPLKGQHIFHVYECEEIEFCKVKGESFNQCQECQDLYAFSKDDDFNKTQCIYGGHKAKNCLIFDQSLNKCYACKKNYFINEDEICEAINTPNCKEQNNLDSFPLQQNFYEVSLIRGFTGCNKCQDNYNGLLKNNRIVCTQRTTFENKQLADNSVLQYSCQTYELDEQGEVKCVDCMDGYVLDINDKCIQMKKNFQNCLVAEDDSSCFKCEIPYFSQDKKCKLYSVENCIQYGTNQQGNVECQSCHIEFLLKDQKCVRGNVDYCEILTSLDTCEKCIDGYQKVELVNSKDYCMPINQYENCLQFDQTQMQQNNKFICNKCNQDFYLKTSSQPQKVCNKFNLVQNCTSYIKNQSLIKSSLGCSRCADGFYLEDNFCHERPFIIERCIDYDKTSQKCLQCDLGYYLSQDRNQCVINPTGIPNCIKYKGENECELCRPEFYLKDSKCIQVPFEYLIQSCVHYYSDLQCQHCQQGKVLEGNQCIDPLIYNCQEFISIRSCRKCVDGYGIKAVEDRFVCVPLTIVSNCKQQDQLYPFSCQFCEKGYVLMGQNCFLLTPLQTVKNCLYYEKPNVCLQCEKDYSRSLDKTQCKQIFKSNVCLALEETETSQCALCQQGFFLNDQNECEPLNNLGNLGENCLMYDQMNSKCQMCQSGFFQNYKGLCIRN